MTVPTSIADEVTTTPTSIADEMTTTKRPSFSFSQDVQLNTIKKQLVINLDFSYDHLLLHIPLRQYTLKGIKKYISEFYSSTRINIYRKNNVS